MLGSTGQDLAEKNQQYVYLVGRPHEIPLLNIGRFQVIGGNC